MGYDRGNSFPFDFEPNEIPFGSKSKGKLLPWSYPIHCSVVIKKQLIHCLNMCRYFRKQLLDVSHCRLSFHLFYFHGWKWCIYICKYIFYIFGKYEYNLNFFFILQQYIYISKLVAFITNHLFFKQKTHSRGNLVWNLLYNFHEHRLIILGRSMYLMFFFGFIHIYGWISS